MLGVSNNAVSKWENSKGLPDISLIEPFENALGVCVIELMSGHTVKNENVSSNILRSKFYVCPLCGNIVRSIGDEEYVAEVLGYASGYPHTYATRAEAKEALRFVSPIYYIDENTVPTIINHGMMDDIVPHRNAVDLDKKLTEYGIEHVLNSYPTSGHGLNMDAENMELAEQLLWEYIYKYLDSVSI